MDTFLADKALFLATACLDYGDNQLHCALCWTSIKWEAAFISAHRVAEECIGTGIIVQVDIPYCPQCEETLYVEVASMSARSRMWQRNWWLDCSGVRIAIQGGPTLDATRSMASLQKI